MARFSFVFFIVMLSACGGPADLAQGLKARRAKVVDARVLAGENGGSGSDCPRTPFTATSFNVVHAAWAERQPQQVRLLVSGSKGVTGRTNWAKATGPA